MSPGIEAATELKLEWQTTIARNFTPERLLSHYQTVTGLLASVP